VQEPVIKDFDTKELVNPHHMKNRVWVTGLEMGIPEEFEGKTFYKDRLLVTKLTPHDGNVEGHIHTYYAKVDTEELEGVMTYVVDTKLGQVRTDVTQLVVKGEFAEKGYVVIGVDLHAAKAPAPAPKRKSSKHKPKKLAPSTAQLLGRLNILKPSVK
jgi:hypothetical protein